MVDYPGMRRLRGFSIRGEQMTIDEHEQKTWDELWGEMENATVLDIFLALKEIHPRLSIRQLIFLKVAIEKISRISRAKDGLDVLLGEWDDS